MSIYLVILITLVAALIASLSQTLYKKNITEELRGIKDIIKVIFKKPILVGFGGYAISLVVYLFALSKAPLSVVYPTFASTFIFITLLSWFVLKEKMDSKRIIGMSLIFIGIVIIAISF
ncbi:MAG: SMR family transporter [Candidatus Marsarchaeota archaeon]|jgi:drug/metabolite transporter (DMT)-like permease|nr:SMR family transporter [Candidatus Marsarchaeota archaeon]MCL5115335.1 SMR family transporter [Candidatus Marsarchaeota archaeon]